MNVEYNPCYLSDPTAKIAISRVTRVEGKRSQMQIIKAKNKYNATKVRIHGIEFDSRREAVEYAKLREKELKGEIIKLELQPKFTLLDGFVSNIGVKVRPITYTADFYIEYADGRREIIEVKGFKTRDYELRKKLLLYLLKDKDVFFREIR